MRMFSPADQGLRNGLQINGPDWPGRALPPTRTVCACPIRKGFASFTWICAQWKDPYTPTTSSKPSSCLKLEKESVDGTMQSKQINHIGTIILTWLDINLLNIYISEAYKTQKSEGKKSMKNNRLLKSSKQGHKTADRKCTYLARG